MENEKNDITLLNDGETPKVKELLDALDDAINNAQQWIARMELADATMWSVWENQTPDGLKHAGANDADSPVPWEGASDTRVRVSAAKVIETTAREALALANANLKISGREGLDDSRAIRATTLFKWIVDSQMGRKANTALVLGRLYRAVYGVNVFNVEWTRDERVVVEEVSFEEFAAANGFPLPENFEGLGSLYARMSQLPEGMPLTPEDEALVNVLNLFYSDDGKDDALKLIAESYPDSSKKRVAEALDAWRSDAPAKLCVRRVVSQKPEWTALLPFDDVFFPVSTQDLQDAPWIAVREWLTPQQVRRMELLDGWDSDFVKAVIDAKGFNSLTDVRQKIKAGSFDLPYSLSKTDPEDDENLCEVFYIYYRAINDEGVEAIYRLVASNSIATKDEGLLYGKNEIYEVADGEYPFIEQTYLRTDKTLLDNVGIPWLLRFTQQNIKNMRDKRLDLADISTIPPITRDKRDSTDPLQLGPASVIYERTRGTTQWLNPPNSRVDLPIELERTELADAGRITGSAELGVPQPTVQYVQQNDTGDYLKSIRPLFVKTFRLLQQFLPTTVVMRVSGAIQKPFETSAEEIRGDFDLTVSYDPSNGDEELKKLKIQTIRELMGMDANGIVDGNVAVKYIAQLIDPSFADLAITDESQGQQKIILEEKQNIALMMTGQSAPLKKEEAGAKLRLQLIMQEMQQNPVVAAAAAQNERIKAVFDQRIKNLQMQLMQQQNKTIGALGVNPNIQ